MKSPFKKNGKYIFTDFPTFTPNLSPKEIFQLGSFGGTYWRSITSTITKKKYRNVHLKYPKNWWSGLIKNNKLTNSWDKYDKNINYYKVKVGQTLKDWEGKNWITEYHPYGWIQWYCDFFIGKRCPDDSRQISRWERLAGEEGRFKKWLITLIIEEKGKYNDYHISPKIRQTLQHWAYKLTKDDFDQELKKRGIKY